MSAEQQVSFKAYTTREEWLKAREGSTGSSGIINILGVPVDGREPNGLWWEWLRCNPNALTEEADRKRYEEIERKGYAGVDFEERTAIEPVIEGWAEKHAGISIFDPGHAIARRESIPRAHASPDGLVVDPDLLLRRLNADEEFREPAWRTFTEYKTIHPFATHHWNATDPSEYAIYQAHWGMLIFGVDGCYVFGHVLGGSPEKGGPDRLVYEIERNEELCELLLETHARFWKYVDDDVPPPVDGFAKTTQAIRLMYKAKPKGSGVMMTFPPEVEECPACGGKGVTSPLLTEGKSNEDVAQHFDRDGLLVGHECSACGGSGVIGGWPDPDAGNRAVPWPEVEGELQEIAERADRDARRTKQLKQAVELEMGKQGAEVGVIPTFDGATTYRRTEVSIKAQTCKNCGDEIRAAYDYVRFQPNRKRG